MVRHLDRDTVEQMIDIINEGTNSYFTLDKVGSRYEIWSKGKIVVPGLTLDEVGIWLSGYSKGYRKKV